MFIQEKFCLSILLLSLKAAGTENIMQIIVVTGSQCYKTELHTTLTFISHILISLPFKNFCSSQSN